MGHTVFKTERTEISCGNSLGSYLFMCDFVVVVVVLDGSTL
jgi:hypothetical protein